jgi:hypothetical protein
VNTGFFGSSETFVPVADAELSGDRLAVPYRKEQVKDAPQVDAGGGHLERDEEERLYAHYGRTYEAWRGQQEAVGAGEGAPSAGDSPARRPTPR